MSFFKKNLLKTIGKTTKKISVIIICWKTPFTGKNPYIISDINIKSDIPNNSFVFITKNIKTNLQHLNNTIFFKNIPDK